MLADLHLHTFFSSDSETNPEDVILKAIELKLPYICFTDHNDFDYEDNTFLLDYESYYDHMMDLKVKYKEQLNILIGVEQGLDKSKTDKINPFLLKKPYDFVIGSSHLINGFDPYYPSFFEGRTTTEAICEYFESILDNLEVFDNFDVYGHIDYVIRYPIVPDAEYCYKKYEKYLEPILKTIISKGKGIELNTGGFRTRINDSNPSLEILKKYKEFGGEIITVGSDAHKICDIAGNFNIAKKYLLEAGFDYMNVFINRMPIKIPLN